MRELRRVVVTGALVLALFACVQTPKDFSEALDYRDVDEGRALLGQLSQRFGRLALYDIGEVGSSGRQQFAVKVGLQPDIEDDGSRNSILFVCGLHGREWYAQESCLWLAVWLNNQYDQPHVQALLSHADVWIVPFANPDGRMHDDPSNGDPSDTKKWRGNRNLADCENGVDLNRNWPVEWPQPTEERCDDKNYPGAAPISEPENRNLRRFINNHTISMVVDVHTNIQNLSALWDGFSATPGEISAANIFMRDEAISVHFGGFIRNNPPPWATPRAILQRAFIGAGPGHLANWLAFTSPCDDDPNVTGPPCNRPDQGTRREIPAFFLELPFTTAVMTYGAYRGQPFVQAGYPAEPTYPSNKIVELYWRDTLLPLFLYFIRQARSPQCPIDPAGARVTAACEFRNYSVVGAKVGPGPGVPGALSFDPSDGMETLTAGPHQVTVVVQNSGVTDAFSHIDVRVELSRENANGTDSQNLPPFDPQMVSVAPGERAMAMFSIVVEPGTYYRLSVNAAISDDFQRDNVKTFRFRAVDAP